MVGGTLEADEKYRRAKQAAVGDPGDDPRHSVDYMYWLVREHLRIFLEVMEEVAVERDAAPMTQLWNNEKIMDGWMNDEKSI